MDNLTLRESLAECAHVMWSGWMVYLFSKCETSERYFSGAQTVVIPAWAVERWTRQMNTPYAELPDEEKESDRVEADGILGVVARSLPLKVWVCQRSGEVQGYAGSLLIAAYNAQEASVLYKIEEGSDKPPVVVRVLEGVVASGSSRILYDDFMR